MRFKESVSFPNYLEVSECGVIRSVRTGNILKQTVNSRGYLVLSVTPDKGSSKSKTVKAHRLIAEVFCNNPERKPNVNPIDGVKTNNSKDNLEWCTQRENIEHARNSGLLRVSGIDNYWSKLTNEDVVYIRRTAKSGCRKNGYRALAKEFGVTHGAIRNAAIGESYKSNTRGFSL